MEKYITYYITY